MSLRLILIAIFFGFLSQNSLAEYYVGKIKNKEAHFWINDYQSEGYYFLKGDKDVFHLLRQAEEERKQLNFTFKVISEADDSLIASIELRKKGNGFVGKWLSLGASDKGNFYFNLEQKNSEVETVKTKEIAFTNENCELEYLDLSSIKDEKLLNRIFLINQQIMSHYNDYGCKYLEQSKEKILAQKNSNSFDGVDVNQAKNKLRCKSEIFLLKKRFYGINFYCEGIPKGQNATIKKRNFIQLYDKQLKVELKKEDFTSSDINEEDDSLGLMFGLSPIGLFLYYSEPTEKLISYQRHIPFYGLKKNFEKWGTPKRFLRHFELK